MASIEQASSAAERAEKLIRLAVSARLFSEADAERARQRARDCLAKDALCPVGRILVHLISHDQLNALLALERYRDERDEAKAFLEKAVAEGRVPAANARAALDAQRAEYLKSSRTIPIRAFLLDMAKGADAVASLGWSREEDLSEFKLQPSTDELAPVRGARTPAERDARPIAPRGLGHRRRTTSSTERLLERRRGEKRRQRVAALAVGLLLGLPLGAYVVSAAVSGDPSPSSSSSEEEVDDAAVRVTAIRLWQDYGLNRLAASERYGDRPLLVAGRIVEIRADSLGTPIVELETGARADRVRCAMDPAEKGAAAALSAGRVVEIRGTCRGPGPDDRSPRMEGCRFVE